MGEISYSLPNEILFDIVKTLDEDPNASRKDFCTLRLVSKALKAIVSPYLFSELRLNATARNYRRYMEIVQALSTGTTDVYACTKTLVIEFHARDIAVESLVAMNEVLQKHLAPAIFSLRNLHVVRWTYAPLLQETSIVRESPKLAASLVESLSSISTLQGFELNLDLPFGSFRSALDVKLQFSPLRNLTTLDINQPLAPSSWYRELRDLISRCPGLERLRLQFNKRLMDLLEPKSVYLRDIFPVNPPLPLKNVEIHGVSFTQKDFSKHLQHFRQLEVLVIASHDVFTFGEICAILQKAKIFLKELSTAHAFDPSFLKYIGSYSGIRKVLLGEFPTQADVSAVIDRFFREVLPKHNGSLRELGLDRWEQGRFRWDLLSESHQREIIKCRELRNLYVSVKVSNTHLMQKNCPPIELWLNVALQLPKLEVIGFRYTPTDVNPAVGETFINAIIGIFKSRHSSKFEVTVFK